MAESKLITIIGGGVIGCAIAYEIARKTNHEVALVDKQPITRAKNQSSHNSGVIHAGIYYSKHQMPLKAELCVRGNQMLYAFCAKHGIPHKKTGKLIVATNQQEEQYLDDVERIARENGAPIQRLTAEEARRYEPNVNVSAALLAPTSGIVYTPAFMEKLFYLLKGSDNVYGDMLNTSGGYEVLEIKPKGSKFEVTATINARGDVTSWDTDVVINSAGLYSDEIAKMINLESSYEIDPVRGEAYRFYKTKRDDIWHEGLNVYPAPYGMYEDGTRARVEFDEFQKLLEAGDVFKTVGVHLTPTFEMDPKTGECLYDEGTGEYALGKTVTVGPAFVGGVEKDDYMTSVPSKFFFDNVHDFFPNLVGRGSEDGDLQLYDAGIMARLKGHLDYVMEHDKKYENFYNLLGMDSPGLTSSFAIAERIVEQYVKGL
jgi:L-2-hydroxyglutarate oxidase LhgO